MDPGSRLRLGRDDETSGGITVVRAIAVPPPQRGVEPAMNGGVAYRVISCRGRIMVEIVWQKWFELGNFRIDSEHRVFLDLVMGLNRDHYAGITPEKQARSLKEILKYAEFHFLSEENMMIDIDYPDRKIHEDEHRRLLARLEGSVARLNAGEDILDEFLTFLYEWFCEHTVGIDYRLAQFIAARTG